MNSLMNSLSSFAYFLLFIHFVDLNHISNSSEYSFSHRSGRNIRSLVPLDCQLGKWAKWSDCSPCETTKSRFRKLQRPAIFGGSPCIGSLWEEVVCQTSTECASINTCGDQFRCSSGWCIKRRLLCNGDSDCEDASDEDVCELDGPNEIHTFCRNLFPIHGYQTIMKGYNILTNEVVSTVLNSGYNGYCEYVYNGDWRELRYDSECEHLYYNDDEKYFRKPYNIFQYRFEAIADSGFSVEVYRDINSLHTALKKENSFEIGVNFKLFIVDVGARYSSYSGVIQNLTSYEKMDVSFVRVRTKIQTAHFKMRRHNLILDEGMIESLMKLPDEYNYGMYSKFIADYGTHYYASGTMGGVFEFFLVMNNHELKKSGFSADQAGSCIAGSLGVLMGAFSVGFEKCQHRANEEKTSSSSRSYIQDVIVHVVGGDHKSIGGMQGQEVPNAKMYRHWGKSLKYVPAIIDFEVMPIYELISRSNLPSVNIKQQHLKTAMEEYLSEFHPCRCHECYNNGSPLLMTNVCSCVCEPGYSGKACQETKRKGVTNGGWDCWSQWSSCTRGSRRRTRNCNHPAPKDGGAMCLGKSTQTQYC
ncbi:complement component C8 alpha chain [Narcine bancroftii]|uniref:complement component C8 alpha chain n=1 Tax=Narcine bancroftii TaxID=1343680 RepID=UPI0038318BA8